MSLHINDKLWTPQEREELIMLSNYFSQNDEHKRLLIDQQKPNELNQMSSSRILLIALPMKLIRAFGIQKTTLKQAETMTQKLTKSIKLQLKY